MATTALATPLPAPESPVRAALQDLLQLGLRVAAVATKLAEAEGQAIDALAEAAAKATATVAAQPPSVEAAMAAGRATDISELMRESAAKRLETITATFERAARAVRRTAALLQRIEEGRPFQPAPPRTRPTPGQTADPDDAEEDEAAERLCDDLVDRLDAADLGDELGGRSTGEIIGAICRDLGIAARPIAAPVSLEPSPAHETGAPIPIRPLPAVPFATPGLPRPPGLPPPDI